MCVWGGGGGGRVVIRLVAPEKHIVKMWYVKPGGGLTNAPKKSLNRLDLVGHYCNSNCLCIIIKPFRYHFKK